MAQRLRVEGERLTELRARVTTDMFNELVHHMKAQDIHLSQLVRDIINPWLDDHRGELDVGGGPAHAPAPVIHGGVVLAGLTRTEGLAE